ncbi:T9SS type A sorting domain-containing protein [Saprospira sp. CCB-QB6]|uniref:T9SS type A sorting domain-containing protein n=1 Tax=Saprospira sp. CCB-QB6 TaxID=3023936 RepID=UPI0023499ACD|nr:T9SS type A sorting domain-containing protein [Saprospira sp. CCB-QB6]WCL79976.1 T9SS type A sorting domain-containing protein [Saprospira sp. CCB-QB6]
MSKIYQLFAAAFLLSSSVLTAQNIVSTAAQPQTHLLEGITGVNCYYCAQELAELKDLAQTHNFVFSQLHTSAFAQPQNGQIDFRNATADALGDLAAYDQLPAAMINRKNMGNLAQATGSLSVSLADWETALNSLGTANAAVNLGLDASLDLSNGQLNIVAESYYTADSPTDTNYLQVYILQDSVLSTQAGAADLNPNNLTAEGLYWQRNVLRMQLPLVSLTQTAATSFQADSFQLSLPDSFQGVALDFAQLRILALVSTAEQGEVLNAAEIRPRLTGPNPFASSIVQGQWAEPFNSICGSTASYQLLVKNLGTSYIDSLGVSYDLNLGQSSGSQQVVLQPSLAPGYSQIIVVEDIPGFLQANNSLELSISEINGLPNPNVNIVNDVINQAPSFQSDSAVGQLRVVFDNYPEDVSWELRDLSVDSLVLYGDSIDAVTASVVQDFDAVSGHCYEFIIQDAFGDGICCGYGLGYYTLEIGGLTIDSSGSFGAQGGLRFSWQMGPTAVEQLNNLSGKIYPNPSTGYLQLELNSEVATAAQLDVYNLLGQKVRPSSSLELYGGAQQLQINLEDLPNGSYQLIVRTATGQFSKLLLIQKP